MMICPAGHESSTSDFCDVCGLPIDPSQQVSEAPPDVSTASKAEVCPNCGAPRPKDALFCESCGYDYTTGALPQQDLHTELGISKPSEDPEPTPPSEQDHETSSDDDTPANIDDSEPTPPDDAPVLDADDTHVVDGKEASAEDTDTPASSDAPVTSNLAKHVPYVAEVWVDPQWYAFQESKEPLPPLGPPRIIALKDSALIGRRSASRNINPDIDCDPDTGCSRRQSYLTSADGYWYINDLDSANGTFVAPALSSLPDEPITGRTQVSPDMRIYVGAWTRIVVRPAIESDPVSA